MDIASLNEHKGSIAQICPPHCYELAGMKFYFWMDDGFDYELEFLDRERARCNFVGKEPIDANYFCAKSDDTTYLVSVELENVTPRECHTFVIDLENWLVTRIIAKLGENPRYPYLITPHIEFGMIKREGVEYVSYPRHGFTSDLEGTVVQWNYGGMETVHIYYCSNFYRITYAPEKAATRTINSVMADMPSSDEMASYIKIKKGIYLFCPTEQNLEKLKGAAFGFRSNSIYMLENYKKMTMTACCFGTYTDKEGNDRPMRLLYGAYGTLREIDRHFLEDPNPYIAD